MNWLLPEYIADALPAEAARIERLRRTLLDHFREPRLRIRHAADAGISRIAC
jgi:ATP phosphoribosyltransferase regulatory subunit HisZ